MRDTVNRVSPVLQVGIAADVGRDAFNGSSTCIQVALDAMLGRAAAPEEPLPDRGLLDQRLSVHRRLRRGEP